PPLDSPGKVSECRSAATLLWRTLLDQKVILMTERVTPRRHGSYGVDAPYAPAFIAVTIVVLLVMAIISGRCEKFVTITFMLAVLGFYLHSTLRGKFVVWADLLNRQHLRGDERISGHGMWPGCGPAHGRSTFDHRPGGGCGPVAKCRSVRQFPGNHSAQR